MKDKHATIIVDLTKSEDEILKGLHKDARWGINKAIKNYLYVDEQLNNWENFYLIYEDTMLKGGAEPLNYEELRVKTDKCFFCKRRGELIGGAGIWFIDMYDKTIPRLFYCASLKRYENLQPNNLLYWEVIKYCKKLGYTKLDLGGWQINAHDHLKGINKFKEKWGGVVYYDKEYPVYRAIGRKLIKNSRLFWWLNSKLKKQHKTFNDGYVEVLHIEGEGE